MTPVGHVLVYAARVRIRDTSCAPFKGWVRDRIRDFTHSDIQIRSGLGLEYGWISFW